MPTTFWVVLQLNLLRIVFVHKNRILSLSLSDSCWEKYKINSCWDCMEVRLLVFFQYRFLYYSMTMKHIRQVVQYAFNLPMHIPFLIHLLYSSYSKLFYEHACSLPTISAYFSSSRAALWIASLFWSPIRQIILLESLFFLLSQIQVERNLGASHSFLHGQNLDINFATMKEVAVTTCSQIKK